MKHKPRSLSFLRLAGYLEYLCEFAEREEDKKKVHLHKTFICKNAALVL